MSFAVCSFVHLDLDVRRGDELAADHPMVALRPDLFTDQPPARRKPVTRQTAARKSATDKE